MGIEDKIGLVITAKDQASKIIKGITGSFTEMNQTLELTKKVYGVVADAVTAVIDAAAKEERQWIRVSNALRTHGLEVESNLQYIKQMTDQLEWQTGVADDLIAEGYQRMVTAGYDVKTSTSAIGLALDIASASSVDFNSALVALIKGGADSTMQLNRLAASFGIVVTNGMSAHDVIVKINEAVRGRAQADLQGYAKALSDWGVAAERFKEDIGAPFLNVASAVVGGGAEIVRSLTDIERAWIHLKNLGGPIPGLYRTEDMLRLLGKDGLIGQTERDLSKLGQTAGDVAGAFKSIPPFKLIGADLPEFTVVFSKITEYEGLLAKERAEIENQRRWFDTRWSEMKPTEMDLPNQSGLPQLEERWREIAPTLVATTTKAASSMSRAFKDRFTDVAIQGTNQVASNLTACLFGAKMNIGEIFRGMGMDFVQFFINEVLQQVTGFLVPGLLDILGHIFDNPKNDAMAARQGHDYAMHFQRGALGFMQNNNLALGLAGAGTPALAGSGGGIPAVNNYYFNNAMTRDFARHELLPMLEDVDYNRPGRFSAKPYMKTGRKDGYR